MYTVCYVQLNSCTVLGTCHAQQAHLPPSRQRLGHCSTWGGISTIALRGEGTFHTNCTFMAVTHRIVLELVMHAGAGIHRMLHSQPSSNFSSSLSNLTSEFEFLDSTVHE